MGPPPPHSAPPRGGRGDGVAGHERAAQVPVQSDSAGSSSPRSPPRPSPPSSDPASAKMRLQNQVAEPERSPRAPNAPPTRRHPRATCSPPACGRRIPDQRSRSGTSLQLPSGGLRATPLRPPRLSSGRTTEHWVGESPGPQRGDQAETRATPRLGVALPGWWRQKVRPQGAGLVLGRL